MYPRPNRLTIGSCDDETLEIKAHYNPKEIDLGKQINWSDEATLNKGMVAKQERDLHYDLQYTGTPARTMALELFLDSYEPQDEHHVHVMTIVDKLHVMSSPRDESSDEPHMRRPHVCVVAWGDRSLPKFTCVIESLAVKFTMFDLTGCPVRAVCSVKLKEARYRSDPRRA